MTVRMHSTPDDFAAVVRWVYRRDPVRYTVELTTARRRRVTDRIMLSVTDRSGLCGAAIQDRDGGLLVTGLPWRVLGEVAADLCARGHSLPSVRGTRSAAGGFVDAWSRETGTASELTDTETLYRLGTLAPPGGVPGCGRLVAPGDDELLAEWLDGFFVDAFGASSDPAASRRYLGEIIEERGRIVLWTVDGLPVSMARVHAPVAGMTRIGPVYTPPPHRGHGYAAAVTAAAAEDAVRRGVRDVVLFAATDNATSNGVYQRIGFVALGEHLRFDVNPDVAGNGVARGRRTPRSGRPATSSCAAAPAPSCRAP